MRHAPRYGNHQPDRLLASWYGDDVANLVFLRRRLGSTGVRASLMGTLGPLVFQIAIASSGDTTPQASSTSSQPPPTAATMVAPARLSEADAALFALPTTHDHIGRIVVPVTINGRGPFRFVVDTGANHSTITPGLAQELGLTVESGAPMLLDGITGSALVSSVTVERLQTGDLTLADTAMPVVSGSVMAGADGILGAAGLSEKSLSIDFRRNRVAIASRLEYRDQEATTRIHASSVSNGLIVLEAIVGGVQVQAVLDTGSERTLGNLALRGALQPKYLSGRGFAAVLTSVYGATTQAEPGEIWRAPTIALGGLRIADVAIVYGDFHIFKVWQMQDRPAMILGMDVLGTVASLGIDFRHRNVYVGGKPSDARDLLQTHGFSTGSIQNR